MTRWWEAATGVKAKPPQRSPPTCHHPSRKSRRRRRRRVPREGREGGRSLQLTTETTTIYSGRTIFDKGVEGAACFKHLGNGPSNY
mmetsp:Transcript_39610/g.99123  ORF Transcript_39610/g.99123 Transcript_39610/m.99123 type:complete len:86 (-) Transcript_39610:1445-1702(-)